jgi:hypothetical protein
LENRDAISEHAPTIKKNAREKKMRQRVWASGLHSDVDTARQAHSETHSLSHSLTQTHTHTIDGKQMQTACPALQYTLPYNTPDPLTHMSTVMHTHTKSETDWRGWRGERERERASERERERARGRGSVTL